MPIKFLILTFTLLANLVLPPLAKAGSCGAYTPAWACGGIQFIQGESSDDKSNRWQDAATYANEDAYEPVSAWSVCPPPPSRDYNLSRYTGERDPPTHLSGISATSLAGDDFTLTGNALIQRGDQQLRAENIEFQEKNGLVILNGSVRLDEPDRSISARDGRLWVNADRGTFNKVKYNLYDRHGRGKAKTAHLLESGVTEYRQATYTTCPESSKFWSLSASSVNLNKNTGSGVARHARMNIRGVPILYTPYLSFPIDNRRKSGFLAPNFGSSSRSGFEFTQPYYFNLAPNYDAIITPRYIEKRGAQINGEFRFLSRTSDSIANIEYLHDDELTNERRTRVTFKDQSHFGDHLSTKVDYDQVSDDFYIRDLGDSLSLASATHLTRSAEANYNASTWDLGVRFDSYQTIDQTIRSTDRPYQRLPQIAYNLAPTERPLGVQFSLATEAVRFVHNLNVDGQRLDIQPELRLPMRGTAYELTPKLGFRHTRYHLDDQPSGDPNKPARTTPIASLDGTVYLERNLSFGSRKYTQTLEPRAYYLYVKHQNQDNLPLFDTGKPTFRYNELFEENRFNGADRVGDANQTTLAVTTRFLDQETGAEQLRASIGQIYYFKDRKVTLDNSSADSSVRSDIAAELQVAISRRWRGGADFVWDPFRRDTQRANATLQFHPGFRKLANLSYRYISNTQSQIDASFLWPISPNWHAMGRWYYDVDDKKNIERLAGIEYDNCCWGIRLVARDFINSDVTSDNADTETSIQLQFVLKGLAHLGNNIENILEDGILGYTKRPSN